MDITTKKKLKIKFGHILIAIVVLITGICTITRTPPVVFIDKEPYWGFSTEASFSHMKFSEKDIKALSRLHHIKTLSFYIYEIELDFLDGMNKLEEFNLVIDSDYRVQEWSPLERCTTLKKFHSVNLGFEDLSVFRNMIYIKTLSIDYLYHGRTAATIRDISDIKYLKNLEYVDIAGNNITDISALGSLSKLKYLYLSGTNCDDYSVLFEFPNLNYLTIDKGELTEDEKNRLKEKDVFVYERQDLYGE